MAQQTTAIMYGVRLDPKDDTNIYDGDNGMLDRWERRERTGNCRRTPNRVHAPPCAMRQIVPHWFPEHAYEGEFVGFVVASKIPQYDGIPELGPVSLNSFARDTRYQKSLKARKKAWERFATWAKKEGYKLPRPKLYLTSVEVL